MPARVTKLVTIAIPHPLALALHPEVLSASPHFVAFAQPDAPVNFRANNFAQLDATLALWSPRWAFPADELAELKATLAMPGATEATLGYYRALASTEPDPLIFNKTTVPTLTLYGTMDGAGSPAPFADQQSGFTLPVRVVPLPSGHFVHREREQEASTEVLRFLRE
jgi:pimeloyl-ACP methyl ester carboxylesterase